MTEMLRCPACTRDPDPRGPSACFACRALNIRAEDERYRTTFGDGYREPVSAGNVRVAPVWSRVRDEEPIVERMRIDGGWLYRAETGRHTPGRYSNHERIFLAGAKFAGWKDESGAVAEFARVQPEIAPTNIYFGAAPIFVPDEESAPRATSSSQIDDVLQALLRHGVLNVSITARVADWWHKWKWSRAAARARREAP